MAHLFVELYNYKSAWWDMPLEKRERFKESILRALPELQASGVEVIGWGRNEPETDNRAVYDFFCVYRTPSAEFTRHLEQGIRRSGWHDLFEQVGVSGVAQTPFAVLTQNVALDRGVSAVSHAANSQSK